MTSVLHDPWFTDGANIWQWVGSIVMVLGWSFAGYAYWHHRCQHCWRPGSVPVHGTVHRVCHHHAVKYGHVHGGPPPIEQ